MGLTTSEIAATREMDNLEGSSGEIPQHSQLNQPLNDPSSLSQHHDIDIPLEDHLILRQESDTEVRVMWNEPHCPLGWAGKPAITLIITQEMLPIKSLRCLADGRDQGWGNTGFSKVSVLLLNSQRELKSSIDLGIAYHQVTTFDFETGAHEIISQAEAGDELGIWAISAPYPGYECIVADATMTVHASFHWRRRVAMMLFLYQSGYRVLPHAPQPEMNPPTSPYEAVRDRVFGNADLTRTITQFL